MARLVTVFGGSGFIGRHVVRRLAARGDQVRVAVRDPEAAMFLKPMGNIGQVVPVEASIQDDGAVVAACAGADAVVNLVGILYERGRRSFAAVHVQGAARVARAAQAAGSRSLVHISAIGADAESLSAYGRSKAAGEAAVRAAFPTATILRPSVVFGAEDNFFNKFAMIACLSPVLPVIGAGLFDGTDGPNFQPVYVGDVADAIVAAVDGGSARGRTYELAGPRVYSFRQIMDLVRSATGRRRPLVPLPLPLTELMGWAGSILPVPPLTRDQVLMMRHDNVAAPGALTLADLGITATPAEAIVPGYLSRYRVAGGLGPRHASR